MEHSLSALLEEALHLILGRPESVPSHPEAERVAALFAGSRGAHSSPCRPLVGQKMGCASSRGFFPGIHLGPASRHPCLSLCCSLPQSTVWTCPHHAWPLPRVRIA